MLTRSGSLILMTHLRWGVTLVVLNFPKNYGSPYVGHVRTESRQAFEKEDIRSCCKWE